jgi:formylglycine-generating enzyme required for sulfatase activity
MGGWIPKVGLLVAILTLLVAIFDISQESWQKWQDVLIGITTTESPIISPLIDPVVGIEMIFVKGGTFTMGCTAEQNNCSDDEKPVHNVTLNDFYLGKYEVTQKQWEQVMANNPSNFKGDSLPVENVSWNNARLFIATLNFMNTMPGKKYRFPTEAEWEYAARGGLKSSGYMYSGSNNINDVAWYESNSDDKTNHVKTKIANELGIYNMSGNVSEWVNDWYDKEYYKNFSQTDPIGPNMGSGRVYRGGSWYFEAEHCRVSFRANYAPNNHFEYLGFRLALSP